MRYFPEYSRIQITSFGAYFRTTHPLLFGWLLFGNIPDKVPFTGVHRTVAGTLESNLISAEMKSRKILEAVGRFYYDIYMNPYNLGKSIFNLIKSLFKLPWKLPSLIRQVLGAYYTPSEKDAIGLYTQAFGEIRQGVYEPGRI